jgi:DNA-binding response OmpR family regulator
MTTDQKNLSESKASGLVILVVDDDHTSLDIVSGCLEEQGFTVLIAEDGESGLTRADYARPDLILLDIMMPGMDGYETCRRLKEQESTKDIPVIFMTALADMEHKVRGFEAGGVDYVTKPVQREEVVARAGVHLHIRELTTGLRNANESLEKRVEERTAELRESNDKLAMELVERKRAEAVIHRLNEELEQRVMERTKELERRNHELEQMNKLFVGRELRMVELKERIRVLEEDKKEYGMR